MASPRPVAPVRRMEIDDEERNLEHAYRYEKQLRAVEADRERWAVDQLLRDGRLG